MAELGQLENAFKKAHAAGDTKAAGALARAIKAKRSEGKVQPVARDWAELPGNIIPSAIGVAEGIYNTVRHPVDTVENLAKVGSGAINNAFPQLAGADKWLADAGLKSPSDPNEVARQREMASQTGAALKDRYVGWDNLRNTMITDPVGIGLDATALASGGAALAGRGPLIGSKTANVARIPGQTRASESLLRWSAPRPGALDNLGDEAMLLDASPSLTGIAQGVVAKPGPYSDQLVNALTTRNEGRSDRLLHGAQNSLGRLRDPEALKSTIDKAGQRAAGPHYKQAKQNPPEFRTPILENLIAKQMTDPASGMTTSNRAKNLEWLNKIDDAWAADNPQDAVSRLHDLRKELDTYTKYDPMASSADKAAREVAKNARNVVDDILKNRIPGFMEGDKIISTSKKAQEAVDFGYNSLEGGKSTMFPETFAKEYAKRDPKYVEEGIKGRIANALGTTANDTAALKRVIGDGNDFNRKKLVRALGQGKTDELVQAVDREQLFGQNFADIARNSQTAKRQSALKAIEGPDAPYIDQSATVTGLAARGVSKGLNALLARGLSKYSSKNSEALAKALSLKGKAARDFADELAKSKTPGDARRKIIKALVAVQASETVNRPHR